MVTLYEVRTVPNRIRAEFRRAVARRTLAGRVVKLAAGGYAIAAERTRVRTFVGMYEPTLIIISPTIPRRKDAERWARGKGIHSLPVRAFIEGG